MTVKEFADAHGVEASAVWTYIRRHPDVASHLTGERQHKVIDATGVALLEEQYKPHVHIAEHDPDYERALEELNQLHKEKETWLVKLNEIKDALASAKMAQIAAESQRALLDDSQSKAEKRANLERERADKLEKERAEQFTKATIAEAEAKELREKLEKLKSRSLWERITNK